MADFLDLVHVRAQFPALSSGWVFLDNAGGSQTLGAVGTRITEYLYGSMVAHGAPHALSQLAQERLRGAAACFAMLLNARDPSEIVMGSSTTQLLQNLGLALADRMAAGDEIVLTDAEHHSNVEPWLRLQEQRGIVLKTWKVDRERWSLELTELDRLMTRRTRLVVVTQCSNILGTIYDAAAIARFVHERGAQVLVDGVAYAPHRAVDVQAWDADYYVLSTYKVFGPHHAVLYGKREQLLALRGTNHSFLPQTMIPYKFQPGNANSELSHGATAIADYLEDLGARADTDGSNAAAGSSGADPRARAAASRHPGHSATAASPRANLERAFAAIAQQEELLAQRLLAGLARHPRLRVIGSPDASRAVRVPTVSVAVEGREPAAVVQALGERGIGVRSGDFYARALIDGLGLRERGGVLRISAVHYNTLDEIDRLLEALEQVV
jgi:selenocysteine lyase/cysteine desulfurase